MENIAIVGGGASGLMSALFINNKHVTIFESAEKYGKKILATGNGRCNLANVNMNKCSYNQNINNYMSRFSVKQCLEFFKRNGLETYHDEEGRVYPMSNTATSVLSVLKNSLEIKNNIKIETNKELVDIFFEKNKYKLVFSDKTQLFFDKVIIASGNYTNLKILDKFNIKYKNFLPSLCSLKTERHKSLSGVRVDNVRVICKDAHIDFEEVGEVLFKDDGISGIVIFNLSSHMARSGNYQHSIFLDFMPDATESKVIELLQERLQNLKSLNVENFLTGVFHKEINLEILKRSNVLTNKKVCNLTQAELKAIAKNIKHFKLESTGFYENNQVMCGGVLLSELDENLQSKTSKGLYFTGEVIDVDGVCGGYNLMWAWCSGHIVGVSI